MNHIFVLEDDPDRIKSFRKIFEAHGFTYKFCSEVEDAKRLVSLEQFNVWLLDHDLGGKQMVDIREENTGSTFAKWVAYESGLDTSSIIICIHSLNPVGVRNMQGLLPGSFVTPFIWNAEKFRRYFIFND